VRSLPHDEASTTVVENAKDARLSVECMIQ